VLVIAELVGGLGNHGIILKGEGKREKGKGKSPFSLFTPVQ
jgi:hypothetical protein